LRDAGITGRTKNIERLGRGIPQRPRDCMLTPTRPDDQYSSHKVSPDAPIRLELMSRCRFFAGFTLTQFRHSYIPIDQTAAVCRLEPLPSLVDKPKRVVLYSPAGIVVF
jgi:hypothetical protein